jgi:hypothetical protein
MLFSDSNDELSVPRLPQVQHHHLVRREVALINAHRILFQLLHGIIGHVELSVTVRSYLRQYNDLSKHIIVVKGAGPMTYSVI